jgi:hypothetical protein
MKKILILIAFLTLFALPAQAQRGHQGHANAHANRSVHEHMNGHMDRRSFGPEHRTHFSRNHYRWFGGRREYFYGGFWFNCGLGLWPDWFFEDDVYFVIGEDGCWYAHSYYHPGLFIRVYRF